MPDYPPLSTQVIGQAESALGALVEPLLARTGITFHQWLVLAVTAASGASIDRGQLIARISDVRKLDRATVEAAIAELTAAGLATADGPVALTDAGRTRYHSIRGAFAAALIGTPRSWAAPPALPAAAVRLPFVLAAAGFAFTAKAQCREDRVRHVLGRPLSTITRPVTALTAWFFDHAQPGAPVMGTGVSLQMATSRPGATCEIRLMPRFWAALAAVLAAVLGQVGIRRPSAPVDPDPAQGPASCAETPS